MLRRGACVADDPMLIEVREGPRCAVLANVLCRCEGADPALEQRTADEVGLFRLSGPDRGIGGAHADVDLIVVEDEFDADLRVELAKLPETGCQPDGADADRRRDPEFTRGFRR